MSFFTTVKANYIIMLAVRNCMSLSATTELPFHIATTNVNLMTFFSILETNNFSRSIYFSRPTLVIHPLLTLISWSVVRLTTTLLLLTPSLIHYLIMSFGVIFIDSAATHQLRKLSNLLPNCSLNLTTQSILEFDPLSEFSSLSIIVRIKLDQLNKLSSILRH